MPEIGSCGPTSISDISNAASAVTEINHLRGLLKRRENELSDARETIRQRDFEVGNLQAVLAMRSVCEHEVVYAGILEVTVLPVLADLAFESTDPDARKLAMDAGLKIASLLNPVENPIDPATFVLTEGSVVQGAKRSVVQGAKL